MADTIQVQVNTNSGGSTHYKNLTELTEDVATLKARIDELGNMPVYEITDIGNLNFGCCYICTLPVYTGNFTMEAPVDSDAFSSCIIYLYANSGFELTLAVDDEKTVLKDENLSITEGAWNIITITSAGEYYNITSENCKIR